MANTRQETQTFSHKEDVVARFTASKFMLHNVYSWVSNQEMSGPEHEEGQDYTYTVTYTVDIDKLEAAREESRKKK